MTREEARREIDSLDFYLQNHTDDYSEESHAAMVMAIKALGKEPCEDAISRKAVVKYIKASDAELGHDSENEIVVEDILNMPPVTPTRKVGKWLDGHTEEGALGIRYAEKICSKCGWSHSLLIPQNYCPKCGSRNGG